MREAPFEVAVGNGVLRGHRANDGRPALLLHGGPAVPDYMDGCALELDGLFATIRYTQRGTPPSTGGPPYAIESHAADALAVLDAAGLERAWAIGHSWGGHLALHLAVTHPERLLGLICVDPLGAPPDLFAEVGATFRRALGPEQVARLDEIEETRRRGKATGADLRERMDMMWPLYFADPSRAPTNLLAGIGVESSTETNASIAEHFERRTLERELPNVRLPALFVHGELDPMPVRSSTETAALIPGANVETIARCGHFPWLDRPGELRRAVERFLVAAECL